MEALAQTLSERVLIARKRLRMTQQEFAQKLRRDGLKARRWTAADISEIENGRMDPRLSELADISRATGIEFRDLFADKPLYLPTDDLHPINAGVRDGRWFHRDDTMHLPNPSWWEGLQSETLPIKISA